jgi:hypothetical protein
MSMRSSSGPGNLARVPEALARGARADAARIAEEAAGAGVHRGDQQEIAGKSAGPAHAHEVHLFFLQRLPDRFEHVAPELGELV